MEQIEKEARTIASGGLARNNYKRLRRKLDGKLWRCRLMVEGRFKPTRISAIIP